MKKWIALLFCVLLLLPLTAGSAEETDEPNRVTEALAKAEAAAEAWRPALERFLAGGEEAAQQAEKRGEALKEALKGLRDHMTYVLEGDTSLEQIGPLAGSGSKIFTIDLNGYVLYAPTFGYGSFALKNGTVADAMAENEETPLRLIIAEDVCLLRDQNTAGLEMDVTGDITIQNSGMIQGVRRLLYQTARSNRIALTNDGVIWSDTYGWTSRAFHQNSRASIVNNGTIVGLVRGLDFHCAGGSLTVEGRGLIIGAAGPDMEFPKVTFAAGIISDDRNLSEEEQQTVLGRLNPYGDKDIETGVGFDLESIQKDYWMNWKITGTVWAARSIMRVKFPQNERFKGEFSPRKAPGSPSGKVKMTVEMTGERNRMTGQEAEKQINALLKSFRMDDFFARDGEMDIVALSRYAEQGGKSHVRFSTADTRWSRMTGRRKGKTYTWDTAEDGTLDAQEPVDALNDYYQMKSALSVAGTGGTVELDRDVSIPEGDEYILLPVDSEIRGEDHHLGGELFFTVDRNATLNGIEAEHETLSVRSAAKVDTYLNLENCRIDTLSADNVVITGKNNGIEHLELICWGGKKEYRIPVAHTLRLVSTERISGAFRFCMDIGRDAKDAQIDMVLMKGNQSKTFTFEGTTGASRISVLVVNDRDPDKAYRPTGTDIAQSYAVYLRVINVRDLTGPDGERPVVVFRDETGEAMYTFAQADDGKWSMK